MSLLYVPAVNVNTYIVPAVNNFDNDYHSVVNNILTPRRTRHVYFDEVYTKIYTRGGVFFVGVYLGLFLSKYKSLNVSKVCENYCFSFSITFLLHGLLVRQIEFDV